MSSVAGDGQDLRGQVALVTGGGRGIGRAVAQALARAGTAVAVLSRSEDQLAETVGAIERADGRAIAVVADVTDPAAVRRAVDLTVRRLGPVTLLVNNAGTPGPAGLDWEVDAEAWWECIAVSLRGAFLCSQAVLPQMIANGSGRIIEMVSTSGIAARPTISATSIAKTGQIRMAEGLAQATRERGISVFAVHPGVVRTQLLLSYHLDLPDTVFVPPERVGELCVRLASGRYDVLSGRFLRFDDDLDALAERADDIARQELYLLRIKS